MTQSSSNKFRHRDEGALHIQHLSLLPSVDNVAEPCELVIRLCMNFLFSHVVERLTVTHQNTALKKCTVENSKNTEAGETDCLKKLEKLTLSLVQRDDMHNTVAHIVAHGCEECNHQSGRVAVNTVNNRQLDWLQFLVKAPRPPSNYSVSVFFGRKPEKHNLTLWSNIQCQKQTQNTNDFQQHAFKLIWNVLLNQGASGMLPGCKGILICFYWGKVEKHFCSTRHSEITRTQSYCTGV